jgi:hypothetical protein
MTEKGKKKMRIRPEVKKLAEELEKQLQEYEQKCDEWGHMEPKLKKVDITLASINPEGGWIGTPDNTIMTLCESHRTLKA